MKIVSWLTIIAKIILALIFGVIVTVNTLVIAQFAGLLDFLSYPVRRWLLGSLLAVTSFTVSWLMLKKPSCKNIITNGLDDLPKAAVELIDNIIKSMRYRKSVLAEVRQELTDHFCDAIKDCKTNKDNDECIAEMADGFGDPQLLGALLRRGKKRCRPTWQKVFACIPVVIVSCVLVLSLYFGWFFTGKPAVTTDYLAIWNQQVRPFEATDDQNAKPFYNKAAQIYKADAIKLAGKAEGESFDKWPTRLSALSDDELQIVRRWVADNTEALKLIRQGNTKPYYWQTYTAGEEEEDMVISVIIPHLPEYKRIAQLLCWEALLHADNGQMEDALEAVNQAYIFANYIRGKKNSFSEQLTAMAIDITTNRTCRIILSEKFDTIGETMLAKAVKSLEQIIAKTDFSLDFTSEQLGVLDAIQRCFVESKVGKDHLYLPGVGYSHGNEQMAEILGWKGSGLKILFTHPGKEQTLKSMDEYFAACTKIADKTPASLKAEFNPVKQLTEDFNFNNIVLGMLLSDLGKSVEYAHRIRINTEATLATMAIIRYYKQNSEFPENLQVLVDAGLLSEIPIDPFSDKDLTYKKIDGGFTLYSFGSNMVDDGGVIVKGGKWNEEGDAVFWPTE